MAWCLRSWTDMWCTASFEIHSESFEDANVSLVALDSGSSERSNWIELGEDWLRLNPVREAGRRDRDELKIARPFVAMAFLSTFAYSRLAIHSSHSCASWTRNSKELVDVWRTMPLAEVFSIRTRSWIVRTTVNSLLTWAWWRTVEEEEEDEARVVEIRRSRSWSKWNHEGFHRGRKLWPNLFARNCNISPRRRILLPSSSCMSLVLMLNRSRINCWIIDEWQPPSHLFRSFGWPINTFPLEHRPIDGLDLLVLLH